MYGSDPNLRWDGQQWHRWNGSHWLPEQPSQYSLAASQPYPSPLPMYQQPYVSGAAQFATDRSSKGAQATIAWILTVCTLGYMLPWAIAATRGKANSGAIGILNFFLGWTFIGWVAALVMACSAHQIASVGPSVAIFQGVGFNAYPQPQAYNSPGSWPASYQPATPTQPANTAPASPLAVPPQIVDAAPPLSSST
jgi:hypothetical protein